MARTKKTVEKTAEVKNAFNNFIDECKLPFNL